MASVKYDAHMAKQYFLSVFIRNETERLNLEVRKEESDRVESVLTGLPDDYSGSDHIEFETVSGDTYRVCTSDVQAVRVLWEPSAGPQDLVRSQHGVRIKFRQRQEVLEVACSSFVNVFDFFNDLDLNPFRFVSYLDEDGEPLLVAKDEIVWISAPTHWISEGRAEADEQDYPSQ
jgi:hypothetical protein